MTLVRFIKALAFVSCLTAPGTRGAADVSTLADGGSVQLIPEADTPELPETFLEMLGEVIPADDLQDVISGIKRGISATGETPLRIRPLHGGMSAKVFSLHTNQRAYVLRIIPRRKDQLEFRREITFSRRMSELNIGPRLFYASESDGIIIMKQLPVAKTFHAGKGPSAKNRKDLASLLGRLHSSETPDSIFDISMYDRTQAVIERIPGKLPALSLAVQDKSRLIDAAISPHNKKTLTHHDLNPNNIIDDGTRLWLIDWELTGAGDPWYDIANAALFFCNTEDQEQEFIRSYLGRSPLPEEQALYYMNKILCFSFYGHVLQIVAADGAFEELDKRANNLPGLKDLFSRGSRWADFSAGPGSVSMFGMVLLKEAGILLNRHEFSAHLVALTDS